MNLQYIHDNHGKKTGVYIPIDDWEKIKKQYPDLETEISFELTEDQKKILDEQKELPISEYQDNDEFLNELKKEYDL